jgi:hypothetical protein
MHLDSFPLLLIKFKYGTNREGGGRGGAGGGEKRMEKVTGRESKNPTYSSYVQLLCTVANIQLF